jgi:hypothetical protein
MEVPGEKMARVGEAVKKDHECFRMSAGLSRLQIM